jgi:hypothetical protein
VRSSVSKRRGRDASRRVRVENQRAIAYPPLVDDFICVDANRDGRSPADSVRVASAAMRAAARVR